MSQKGINTFCSRSFWPWGKSYCWLLPAQIDHQLYIICILGVPKTFQWIGCRDNLQKTSEMNGFPTLPNPAKSSNLCICSGPVMVRVKMVKQKRRCRELLLLPPYRGRKDDALPHEDLPHAAQIVQPIFHGSLWFFMSDFGVVLDILNSSTAPGPCVIRTSQVMVPMRTQMLMAQMGVGRRQEQLKIQIEKQHAKWKIMMEKYGKYSQHQRTINGNSSHTSIPFFLHCSLTSLSSLRVSISHFC